MCDLQIDRFPILPQIDPRKNDLQSGIEQRIEESRLQREEAQRQEDETLGSRDRGVVAPLGTRELMELQVGKSSLKTAAFPEQPELTYIIIYIYI